MTRILLILALALTPMNSYEKPVPKTGQVPKAPQVLAYKNSIK